MRLVDFELETSEHLKKSGCKDDPFKMISQLNGGFSPSKKYFQSQNGNFLQVGGTNMYKILETI